MDEEPAALAHIEKTLADAYRKEIDLEENAWRSLPFFAATLALQMAALSQLLVHLPPFATAAGYVAAALLCGAVLLNLVSLAFLAAVIYPRRFNYVAREPEMLAYAEGLMEDEIEAASRADPSVSAITTLKRTLAQQYAESASHNRQINKRRERVRSLAGLATLGSVVLTVLLVVTIYTHYILDETIKETARVSNQARLPSSSRAWLQPRWDKI